jgi:hypothetical protein
VKCRRKRIAGFKQMSADVVAAASSCARSARHYTRRRSASSRNGLRRWTEDQKKRQAAGVLPFLEAIDAISQQTLALAREFPIYRRDGGATLQAHLRRFPDYRDVVVVPSELATTDVETEFATSAQWARMIAIRAALRDATVT